MPSSFSLQKFISKPRLPPPLPSSPQLPTNGPTTMLLPSFGSVGGALLHCCRRQHQGRRRRRRQGPPFQPIPSHERKNPQLLYGVHSLQAPPFSLPLHAAGEGGGGGGRNCGDSVRDGKGRSKEEKELFFLRLLHVRHLSFLHFPSLDYFFFAISARVPKRTRADALTDPNNSGWHAPDFPSKIVKRFLPSSSSLALSRQSGEKSLLLSSYGGRGSRGRRDRHHSAGHSLAIVCVCVFSHHCVATDAQAQKKSSLGEGKEKCL